MTDEYNYAGFDMAAEAPYFEAFPDHLHVGDRAPSGTVEELDSGDPIELSSLWRNGPAVLEFGSFT